MTCIAVEDGWIDHTGELPGYNSSIMFNPQTRTSVVVMVNSDIPPGKANPAPDISHGLKEVLATTP
jgi:D-alanyl-D-alanine carboxypeptidase